MFALIKFSRLYFQYSSALHLLHRHLSNNLPNEISKRYQIMETEIKHSSSQLPNDDDDSLDGWEILSNGATDLSLPAADVSLINYFNLSYVLPVCIGDALAQ